MRGNTAKRIISETSEETRAKASEYSNTLINKPMTAKELKHEHLNNIIEETQKKQKEILQLKNITYEGLNRICNI